MVSHLTTESETRRFLAEFVRYAKPKTMVETGCHDGETTLAVGEQLQHIAGSQLYTCDIEPIYVVMTRNKVSHLPVLVSHQSGVELIATLQEIDIAFLDSGGNLERVKEAVELMPRLSEKFWVFLHDAIQTEDPCFSTIAELTGWNSLLLPYGRGVGMFWR